MISIAISFIVGGFFGIALMCLLCANGKDE